MLFNGQDLENWSIHPNNTREQWKVVDGAIQGETKKAGDIAYLASRRKDFDDFHLRMEVLYKADYICYIFFRSTERGWYQAQIRSANSKTGSVTKGKFSGSPVLELKTTALPAPPPMEWFTYEIIARGDTITTLVNGVKHVDNVVDEDKISMSGGFTLDVREAGSIARFRKIEIIPLPPLPVKK